MISIVIINYNGNAFIKPLMESLNEQSFRDFEVIVVDNSINDKAKSTYCKYPFPILYIKNIRNRGFPSAVNSGIEYALNDKIVLLNNDIKLHPDFLSIANRAMNGNDHFFAPLVMNYSGDFIDSAGDDMGKDYKPYKRMHMQEYDHIKADRINGFSMSACFFRKSAFISAGRLREDFFLYFEDAEFSLRLRRAGIRVYLEPDAVAYHYISAATKAISNSEYTALKVFCEGRNRILLIRTERKHIIIQNALFILYGTITSTVFHLIKTHYTIDYLSGVLSGLKGMVRN